MRIATVSFCLLFCFYMSWSCSPSTTSSGDGGGNDSGGVEKSSLHIPDLDYATTAMTDIGSFKVSYTASPAPIPWNKHFDLEIQVQDAKDPQASLDVEVEVDAAMPAHKHGMNSTAQITKNGKGQFEAKGMLFHMRGHWEIYVTVKRDRKSEKATFNVFME